MKWCQELTPWLEAGLQLVLPACCPQCGAEVVRRDAWCGTCLNEVWNPLQLEVQERGMRHVELCQVLTVYGGAVRRLLHGLKFERRRRNAAPLAWLLSMADEAELARLPLEGGLVVPVPLSAERREERGYNQVELIFCGWCRERELDWEAGALLRLRATSPQWELNRRQRADNLQGAFYVSAPERVRGRRILLVDDIVTTGKTLEECARVLLQAGAASVAGLALTHGDNRI